MKALLAFKGQYHHHKETMAHAALLVQLGVLAWLLCLDRILVSCYLTKILLPLAYVLIWCVITCYIGWQLYNRTVASRQVDKLINALADRTTDEEKLSDLLKGMTPKCGGAILGTGIVLVTYLLILIIALAKVWYLW